MIVQMMLKEDYKSVILHWKEVSLYYLFANCYICWHNFENEIREAVVLISFTKASCRHSEKLTFCA